jgi:hypothetical protein
MLSRLPIRLSLALITIIASLPAVAMGATPLPTGTEIHVNAGSGGLHFAPSVAVFPDGGFVVVWTYGAANGGPTVIHARLFAADGSPASGELRLTEPAAGPQHADHVVADRDGSFLVAWTEDRVPGGPSQPADVYVRRFRRDGTPKRNRLLVNVDRTNRSDEARLAVGADGRFAVAWSQEKFKYFFFDNAMVRLFRADGTALNDGILVSPGDPGIGDDTLDAVPTGVALEPDGGLSVLYEWRVLVDATQIFVKHYSRRGGETRRVQLSHDGDHTLDGSSLAMARDGSLVAAWSDESDITAERLNSQGVRLSDPFTVSNRRVDIQREPKLAALPDGGFAAAWVEPRRDGDDDGIFARLLAADGSPLTRDLRMNVTTAGTQSSPEIAAGPQGTVVVVWQQGGTDIFARLLTPH